MAVSVPTDEVLAEFLGPTTRHVRRIEIYEADGETRWAKDTVGRLKDGSVTVDYDRDERRALDLTLSNEDGVLINAPGEFWYDKIIKVYRGVKVNKPKTLPKVLIIADSTTNPQAVTLRHTLAALGYGDTQINTLATDYSADLASSDIIVGLGGTDNKGALLFEALENGKSVITFRESAQHLFDAAFGTTGGWTFEAATAPTGTSLAPMNVNDPRTLGWQAITVASDGSSYNAPTGITTGTSLFGMAYANGSTTGYAITSFQSNVLGKSVNVHYPLTVDQYSDVQFQNFLRSVMLWIDPVVPLTVWEVQIGEFMIDRISEVHFPYEMKITGRDYTKKCMMSKFSQATQFGGGSPLEGLIRDIAANAGITKMMLPVTGVVIDQSFFFDRNTSRWDAMKQIATAYNYEIFFDASGYLVIRPFRDPTTSTPVMWVQTGKDGQMASYEKSTTDTSLFNHILVTGESSDQNVIPVYAESINTDVNSKTSVAEIGDRYWEYSSPLITAQEQAQDLANSFLAIHSLEEFELSFDSLVLPWLEAGEIIGWLDPNPAPGDPRTFLLTSLTLPLKLGPMSAVGKRTTIVG